MSDQEAFKMSWTILPPVAKKPNPWNQRLQAATQAAGEFAQKEKQNQTYQALGIPPGTPPELAKLMISENMKSKSKLDLQEKKMEQINSIMEKYKPKSFQDQVGVNKPQEQRSRAGLFVGNEPQEQMQQQSQPQEEDQGSMFDPTKMSDEDIAYITTIDKDTGNIFRQLKDVGLREKRGEKELGLKQQKIDIEKEKLKLQKIDKSFADQKDFIDQTTSSYKSFETDTKPKLLQMQAIPDEDLASPTASVFLDKLGIPLGALADPASELYQKLSLDLLKGLPEIYGNRILKVEVDNFLKTIPSLMNSPDGRRMIASNMLKLGEMKEVYYNQMRQMQKDSLDNEKPLPKDFQQRVFDQVKPQIDRINDQFVKLSSIKKVEPGTIPFFGPNNEVFFVPKEKAEWASKNGGKRIW